MRLGWFALAFIAVFSISPPSPADDNQAWSAKLWPPFEGWKTPSFLTASPKEPAFVQATRQTMEAAWDGTKRTTKTVWDKTVYVLRPYDNEPAKGRGGTVSRREADAGFWSNLFARPAKQEPMTVNEFLRQPVPQ